MQFFRNLTASVKRANNLGRLPYLSAFQHQRPKFVATVEIDYVQRVTIGLEASTVEHAQQLLKRTSDAGTLFNDTSTMPILMHAFEPVRADSPLQLVSLEEVDELPPADQSVSMMKCFGASYALLSFARMIDALCEEAIDPEERHIAMVGIDVPMEELTQLRSLLRTLDGC